MQKQTKKNSNLWNVLDWIFKTKKIKLDDINVSLYILNRWLSMATPSIANIVNVTGNRWSKTKNEIPLIVFYNKILPSHTKKINYIKKNFIDNDIENLKEISDSLELSTKEIIFLEKSIDELKTLSK